MMANMQENCDGCNKTASIMACHHEKTITEKKTVNTETLVKLCVCVFMDQVTWNFSLVFCDSINFNCTGIGYQTSCIKTAAPTSCLWALTESLLILTAPSQTVSQLTAVYVQREFLFWGVNESEPQGKLIKPSCKTLWVWGPIQTKSGVVVKKLSHSL